MGIKLEWLDKVIDDRCAQRDHSTLTQKERQLSTQLVELQEIKGGVQQMLVKVRSCIIIELV